MSPLWQLIAVVGGIAAFAAWMIWLSYGPDRKARRRARWEAFEAEDRRLRRAVWKRQQAERERIAQLPEVRIANTDELARAMRRRSWL